MQSWPLISTDLAFVLPEKRMQIAPPLHVQLATGTTTLIPAPPAGYAHVLLGLRATNNSASALTWVGTEVGFGVVLGMGASVAAAASVTMSFAFPLLLRGALTITVAGVGTPFDIVATYARIPDPTNVVRSSILLTSSYQTVAGIVPITGDVRVAVPMQHGYFGNPQSAVANSDSANTAPFFRVTRGALTLAFPIVSAVTALQRGQPTNLPSLIAGDLLEAKCNVAPNTPGSISLQLYYVLCNAA